MAAYQAEAQTTLSVGARAKDASRSRLPQAQLYISLNAHAGRPDVLTNWMDASVTDETRSRRDGCVLSILFAPKTVRPIRPISSPATDAAQRDRNQKNHGLGEARTSAPERRRHFRSRLPVIPHLGGFAVHGSGHRSFAERLIRRATPGRLLSPTADLRYRPASTLRAWLSMWSSRDVAVPR